MKPGKDTIYLHWGICLLVNRDVHRNGILSNVTDLAVPEQLLVRLTLVVV